MAFFPVQVELKFTVLANDKGVANDFWNYAKQGLMEYYGESSGYVWSHMFASSTDSYFNNKGIFGEQTGFYDVHGHKDSDTVKFNLAIVHVVTDGKNSAVICVSVNGFKDDITYLHDIIFAEHDFNPVLEDVSSDVFHSFTFRDDGTEVTLDKDNEKAPFGYRDAYEKFQEVYSWGSHADYIEYVEYEADKLKNEVFRTNNEIMKNLKEKCDYISEEIGTSRTYDDYYQSFIAPYEKYYIERMEAAELSFEGYYGISAILTFGGNAAGDCAVLWKYVHYQNLLDELLDLKAFLG